MKVRYALRARADMEEISDYLGQRNPQAARRVIAAIRRSIVLMQTFPRRGRKQKERGVRRVSVPKYPYHIYYRIDEVEQLLVIIQVRHTARRPRHKDH